ncbi:Predicted arabinose efflux permease, MFS family [Halobacillus karajensis]|uniref:Multidrug-efflux transporterc/MT1297 n=1 Tax=Halobacillus karajensis TaxID=195088 RepID=A0A024P8U1_9BACI|nr:MFS transporter [Halobacillus karajensis]CDQ21415.1 putative multidrug-efflux transporterc/MT1297 [Halobacillus karajensis]CDQ25350.1 putative multidrug-efflux transporterc/MT1297 [Halobacillus karajensis]CDQ29674.1 putative multidrug-efflux transporterc/MT1297 [Halobacillus karajensis]SEI07381.1 Predicted arabinose efflux permease, MFS family [Halobacillus karajensis]
MNRAAVFQKEGKPEFKHNHEAFRFIGGNLISFFGDQIYLIALPLIVLSLTGSPLSMGIVAAMERIPVLLQPFAGVMADQLNRKRILMMCDFLRFILIGSVGVAYIFEALSIGVVYVAAFFVGILGQLYQTSQFASIPKLVRKQDLDLVNSLNTGMFQTAVFLAPGLGGWIAAFYNPGVGLILNSFSFFIGFLVVWSLRLEDDRGKQLRNSFGQEIKAGFYFVFQKKPLFYTNLAMLISVFGTTLFLSMFIVHLKGAVGFSPVTIGWVLSVGGLGAVGGALAAPIIRKRMAYRMILFNGGFIGGVSIFLLNFYESFIILALLNAVGTICASISSPCIVTLRQKLTPDHLLGRVQATSRFMTWALMPLAALLAGVIGEYVSTGMVMATGGLISSMAAFIYLHPSLKEEIVR